MYVTISYERHPGAEIKTKRLLKIEPILRINEEYEQILTNPINLNPGDLTLEYGKILSVEVCQTLD